LNALDRYGPVVSIVDNVNVTVSHARSVPIHRPLQTPAQTVRRYRERVLPDPMLSRPGPIPTGPGWRYEVKWDGFRALVSTVDGLRVRSRRGWDMTPLLPELGSLPAGLLPRRRAGRVPQRPPPLPAPDPPVAPR
jgi:ATP-dependent DNA ligase